MKTPMQLIVDRANLGIEAHESELSSSNISNIERNRHSYLLNVCKMFYALASELLEKEKQIIIDAANHGANFDASPFINAENYYSETFKND